MTAGAQGRNAAERGSAGRGWRMPTEKVRSGKETRREGQSHPKVQGTSVPLEGTAVPWRERPVPRPWVRPCQAGDWN